MQSCYFLICVSLSYDINHIRQVNVSSQHLSRSKFSTRSDIIITILLVKILMIPNIAFWQMWRQSTNNYSHKFFVFCSSMTFYRVYGLFFKQCNTYVLYLLIGAWISRIMIYRLHLMVLSSFKDYIWGHIFPILL